ncbi:LITAF domain-containing protein-like isoform X2 [Pleurodeles waltl]|uniref:LITAF domain-containing protein-like isoform X2 n=1 Tax=Pleurodeles waltl TaxID=8319 RepID=UPI003709AB6D
MEAPEPGLQEAEGVFSQLTSSLFLNHTVKGARPAAAMYGQPVVASPPVIVVPAPCGDTPVRTTCPACHQQIVTSTRPTPGLLTWLLFGGFILFGCWLGCCLIPFCVDSLQDVNHFCPNCNHLVGRHKRL